MTFSITRLPPRIIAHRGYASRHPENTLAAFRAAVHAGARFVETDIQITRDGVPVLFHDRTLDRLCGVPGAVHLRTARELARLRVKGPAGAPRPIPALDAFVRFLARNPRVTAFVEVKRISLKKFGMKAVLGRILAALAPVRKRCVLISFSADCLLAARAQCSLPMGAVIGRWRERTQPEILRLRPEYLFCDVEGLPRKGNLRIPGARVVVYEVPDPRRARELSGRGVWGVETFAVQEVIKALRGRHAP